MNIISCFSDIRTVATPELWVHGIFVCQYVYFLGGRVTFRKAAVVNKQENIRWIVSTDLSDSEIRIGEFLELLFRILIQNNFRFRGAVSPVQRVPVPCAFFFSQHFQQNQSSSRERGSADLTALARPETLELMLSSAVVLFPCLHLTRSPGALPCHTAFDSTDL